MLALVTVVCSTVLAIYASADTREALVIGNGTYTTSPLRNPVNDARDMAEALERYGFQVTLGTDLGRREMRNLVRTFAGRIRGGGVSLFYYAGHGVQVDGRNFLIPVDAEIQQEFEIPDEALEAGSVLRAMEEAGNLLNVIVLDACRDNPFARGSRSATRGLARMSAPTGSIIAYATAPGQVAADGNGRNGVYTKHLLTAMATQGAPLEQVFKRVRIDVQNETGGRQVPWEESSLTGDFYFVPAIGSSGPPSPPATTVTPDNREQTVWQTISSSKHAADFEQFLRDFPNGLFAGYARRRLAELQPARPAQQEQAPPAGKGGPDLILSGSVSVRVNAPDLAADQHYAVVSSLLSRHLAGLGATTLDDGLQASAALARGATGRPQLPVLMISVVGATAALGPGKDSVQIACHGRTGDLVWSFEERNFFASSRRQSLEKVTQKLLKKLNGKTLAACISQ